VKPRLTEAGANQLMDLIVDFDAMMIRLDSLATRSDDGSLRQARDQFRATVELLADCLWAYENDSDSQRRREKDGVNRPAGKSER
jgi:hypothetical protein